MTNPFTYEGFMYISTGGEGGGGSQEKAEAYKLMPRAEYTGETRTYTVPKGREDEEYYDSLRTDPKGFYNGMLVTWGKQECVLVGPELTFAAKLEKGKPVPSTPVKKMKDIEAQLETALDERDREGEAVLEELQAEAGDDE